MFKIAEVNIKTHKSSGFVIVKRFFPLTDDDNNKKLLKSDKIHNLYYTKLLEVGYIPKNFSPINIGTSYNTYESAFNVIKEYETKLKEGLIKIYDIEL